MKKIFSLVTALLMMCFLFPSSLAGAEGERSSVSEKTKFSHFAGVIKEVKKTKGQVNITVETEGKDPLVSVFMLTDDPKFFNSNGEAIKKDAFTTGKKVDVFYDGGVPRIAIYPAQIVPEAVVLRDEKQSGRVYAGVFNEALQSLDGTLKLNISNTTAVVNKKGEKVSLHAKGEKHLLVFYQNTTRSIPAQTTPTKVVVWSEAVPSTDASNYLRISGKIQSIEKKNDITTVTLETGEVLKINKESRLFNSGNTREIKASILQKGQQVDAYYDKNRPMILIYPPQITPDFVVLNDDKNIGFVKIGKFDDKLVSLDQQLKLSVTKKTVIVNENGKKIKVENLKGKELIVFYNFTARNKNGYPEQTTPTKIIAVSYLSPEMKELEKIIGKDFITVDGVKMVPLRKVAEYLGFEVISLPKQKAVLLKKGNSSIIITRGELMYSYNKSLRKLGAKPRLKGNTTYISEDFLEEFLNK